MCFKETEKENFVGALAVGGIAGVFAAIAVVMFLSEYGATIYAASKWSLRTIIMAQAMGAFVVVGGVVIALFGVVPAAMAKLASRNERGPNV